MLGVFFFLEVFSFFCFACLTSAFKVVHSSGHGMSARAMILANFPVYSSCEYSSSESSKVTNFLFLDSFLNISCFLRKHLVGLIFPGFQSLSLRTLPLSGLYHLSSWIPVLPFFYRCIWHSMVEHFLGIIIRKGWNQLTWAWSDEKYGKHSCISLVLNDHVRGLPQVPLHDSSLIIISIGREDVYSDSWHYLSKLAIV